MEVHYRNLSEVDFGTNWIAFGQANEVYTINMQLLDCEGNQKAALVPKHLVSRFKSLLEEGRIYEIRRFNVWDAKPDYKVVDENWTIHIKGDTTITLLDSDDVRIPRYKFGFVNDDNVLASRSNKRQELTDIYGIISGFSNLIPVTTQLGVQNIKRDLELEIKGNIKVTVTLWEEKTKLVDESILGTGRKPVAAVITSTVVSNYNAKFSYGSTLATKIYLHISIPEIDEILQSSQQSSTGVVNLLQSNMTTKTVESVDSSLAEMMSDVWNSKCENKRYMVDATVMKLGSTTSWSYISCPKCKRTIHNDGDGYNCGNCSSVIDKPKARFRLGVEIFDATRAITVTAFDNVAEAMVGRSVEEMIKISNMDNGESRVEKIFDNVIGLDAIFEFKPTEDNTSYKGNRLTIKRISKLRPPKQSTINLSQLSDCMIQSDQSSTIDNSSPSLNKSSDRKGKKLLIEEKKENNSFEEDQYGGFESASMKKRGRKGVVIDELISSVGTCDTKKKRKKRA